MIRTSTVRVPCCYVHVMGCVLAIVAGVFVASCGSPRTNDWTLGVEPLPSPARGNSSEPQLSTSARGIMASWIEREGPVTLLKYAERTRSGWTEPVAVVSGSDWFLSYADVPSVMRKADGTLVAQWLRTTDPRTEGYDLLLSYSTDDGKTWSAPFRPHHDGKKFQHGFASFFDLPRDGLGVVWLDGRNSEFLENDPTSGTMTLRYAAFDSRWKQTDDTEIDHNVCECCSTAATVTADGPLVAFRDHSEKEVRDIAVSHLENGKWTPSATVFNDNWELYACPVNGPALSARERQAAVAWFTVKNDEGHAYAAFSSDAGKSWGAPIRLDESASLGRVDVELLDDGRAVASWVEYRREGSQLRIRLVDPMGQRSAPLTIASVDGGRGSGFPRMARNGDELVFAWSSAPAGHDGDVLTVFTARAELP
jgi:hypothetical protein